MKYTMETLDKKEFMQHYNGPALYYSIWKFQQFLRNKWKYKDTENGVWLQAATELTNILIDNGINMDEDYN